MTQDLHQIIYVSSANSELTEEALIEILKGSQKRNAEQNITGLLLHSDGNIIQVIEGPKDAVDSLFAKIYADKRHSGVTLISNCPIKKRDFPEFKMGFKRARKEAFNKSLPGFTDIVEQASISKKQLEGLSKLVATFIRTFAKTTKIHSFEDKA